MRPLEVLIAIQARSTSSRFPRKIFETIGERRLLDHVIDRAAAAAEHVQRHTTKVKVNCSVAVLHPDNDEEIPSAFRSAPAFFIAGPENDVLARYVTAQRVTGADYIVRLTSDCPLVFPFIIAKHINCAAFSTLPHVIDGPLHYLSNVDEGCRSVADGLDCEIISADAIQWLDKHSLTPGDREHVTSAIRRKRPHHLRQGFVSMQLDTSGMKLSVDTPEDLERIRTYFHTREGKMETARSLFNKAIYEL